MGSSECENLHPLVGFFGGVDQAGPHRSPGYEKCNGHFDEVVRLVSAWRSSRTYGGVGEIAEPSGRGKL